MFTMTLSESQHNDIQQHDTQLAIDKALSAKQHLAPMFVE
jgi:hypothetical protein